MKRNLSAHYKNLADAREHTGKKQPFEGNCQRCDDVHCMFNTTLTTLLSTADGPGKLIQQHTCGDYVRDTDIPAVNR